MSILDQYVADVTSTITNVDINNTKRIMGGEVVSGIDPITIITIATTIIKLVMEIIEKCKEPDPAKVAKIIKNPGLFNRIRFNRLIREEEPDKTKAALIHEACLTNLKNYDEKQVAEVVKNIKLDYWLI